jgi:two-component system sensor histidine kinase/response regulator
LGREEFCLLLSPVLNALLVGEPKVNSSFYQVNITWDRQAIADFLSQLAPHLLPSISFSQPAEEREIYQDFFYQLFGLLVPEVIGESNLVDLQVFTYKPVENVLRQQIAQERLINQVIAQIRQSLELSSILETAVREVRNFLQVDRLVIYQFQIKTTNKHPQKKYTYSGKITYESLISNTLPSLLNVTTEEDCFIYVPHFHEKYRRGLIVGIEDVENAYSSSFCLADFLSQYQIKSKLIAPILVGGELWGLLIAHQCFQKRQWFESEKNFLGQIGEHLAIAIYQAQLYAQVQEQKKNFELRVVERTQELRDTLLAAEAAHRLKSEFLGNVSHELRTPLTSIIGLSGTLLHWSHKGSSLSLEKQQQYLKMIHESGQHLLDLIDEIIDFSQIESGKVLLNIKKFSLSNLCRNILHHFQEEAREKKIRLELDLQIELIDDDFYADLQRVKQILFHLLNNAIKFTPDSGTVILRVWREGDWAVFQIEDTGIGIAAQHLPLLFKKFQQLEKSRQRTHGGTGLGLALTKQLIELHHGRIEVESTPGRGSLFTIWLPNQFQRQLKPLASSTTSPQPSLTGKSIVLVATDEEIATLICELLTAANYQVVWLIDSLTAVRQIELLQPAAVILEWKLPDAYQVSQSLKQLQKTRSIKILLLCDKITSEGWHIIFQYGIDDYLLIPFPPALLLQRVSTLISYNYQADR